MGDTMNLLLLVLLFGCGIYALYTAIRLTSCGYLFENKFLYPGNCSPADCADEVGFMEYILPRLWALGIVCILIGIVYVLNIYFGLLLPYWFGAYVLPWIVPLICVWYIIVQSRAAKRFW